MKVYFKNPKQVIAEFDEYKVITDQPVRGGGEGIAPAPFDYFLASLATCAGIYVKGFCDNRNIDSSEITLEQDIEMDYETKVMSKITILIITPSDFPEKYNDALISVASLCLVKKQLKDSIKFDIKVIKK